MHPRAPSEIGAITSLSGWRTGTAPKTAESSTLPATNKRLSFSSNRKMFVECHICYEPLIADQGALALDCGHVCCGTCLQRWLSPHLSNQRCCPFCRYEPPTTQDITPRPIFLKFSDHDTIPRTRTLSNLDGAMKNAGMLRNLLQGAPDMPNLTRDELHMMLDQATGLTLAMQELYRVREFQEVLSDISAKLSAIHGEFPLQDQLEMARHELKTQKVVESQLRQQAEKDQETIRLLKVERENLKTSFRTEKTLLQDGLEQFANSSVVMRRAIERFQGSIGGDVEVDNKYSDEIAKIIVNIENLSAEADVINSQTENTTITRQPLTGGSSSPNPPSIGGRSEVISLVPATATSSNAQDRNKAFVDYYCFRLSKNAEIKFGPSDNQGWEASSTLLERQILRGEGISKRIAEKNLYRVLCSAIRNNSNWAWVWDEFVASS